jgi:hypothetical protein
MASTINGDPLAGAPPPDNTDGSTHPLGGTGPAGVERLEAEEFITDVVVDEPLPTTAPATGEAHPPG